MKKTESQERKQAKIINNFIKTLYEYRKMIASNFQSRMGDENDATPLEKQMAEQYKSCPSEIRIYLSFFLLKVVAKPYKIDGEPDQSIRLSLWLQELAFKRLAKLEMH